MDQAILARLILDDALGALPPDASALLAAYVQILPEGGERLAEWHRVAAAARAAMPTESVAELPPFSARKVGSNPWRIGSIGLAAAAVLAMGVGIGLWMPRRATVPTQLVVVPQPIVAETQSSSGVHDFWSSNRLLASAMEQKHEPSAGWHWSSPINQSEMEGVK